MSDADNEKTHKNTKHVYNEASGLSIMIYLYMAKYIYYHIDKARHFIDEDERGKKEKSSFAIR